MSESIQTIENDMKAYKAALKEINMAEKNRLEKKYPITSKYKNDIPQSSVDVMIEKLKDIDPNYKEDNGHVLAV